MEAQIPRDEYVYCIHRRRNCGGGGGGGGRGEGDSAPTAGISCL